MSRNILRSAILALLIGLGLCGSAQATASVNCTSTDGDASIGFGFGNLPIISVIGAQITAPNIVLSTSDGSIGAANGFADAESMKFDFTDESVSEIVARLRLFRVYEQDNYVMAGTLQIVGHGAYAVVCEGP